MTKKRNWQVYAGRPNRVTIGDLRVTLNHRKVFLLNQKVFEAMGFPAAVELRYDEDTRTIGMAPKDPRNLSAFPLKGKVNNNKYKYRTVHGSPFCKQFGIDPKGTILFTNIDLDNDGTLILELNAAVPVGRGFR